MVIVIKNMYASARGAEEAFQRYSASRSYLRPLYNRYVALTHAFQRARSGGIDRRELRDLQSQARRLRSNLYEAQWWGEAKGEWRGLPAHLAWPLMEELEYLAGLNYNVFYTGNKRGFGDW